MIATLLLLDLFLAGAAADLAHPSFARRERASQVLGDLGPLAVPILERIRSHPDPEARRRAGLLREDWDNSFRATASAVPPWIDMLPDGFADRQAVIDRHLTTARGGYGYGTALDDWPEYRLATLLLVDELREAGWPRLRVVALLDAMVHKESEYRRRMRINYPPDE